MKFIFLVVLLLALASPICSQESSVSDSQDTSQGSTPASLAGQKPSIRPLTEGAGPNFLSGGIAITQLYTDNAELSTANKVSDLSYAIAPHLAITKSTVRLSYDVGVLGGFLVNRKLNNRNQATEGATGDLAYRVSQFVSLRFSDSFTNSSGLWSGANGGTFSSQTGIGSLEQPNNSAFSFDQFRQNTALAELSGQLNAAGFAGIRATHTYLSFPAAPIDPVLGALYGGNSYSAEAFYNHQFSARNWGGVTVRAQRFDIERSLGRTDAATFLLMYAVNLRPNASLSFFGGPELSVSSTPQGALPSVTFQRRLWSPVAGTEFGWQGRRNSAMASFTRQISNSGGLQSAVTLSAFEGQCLRQFGRHLQIGPAFAYSRNEPLVTSARFRTYSGQLQSIYRVGKYSFIAGYARDDRAELGGSEDSTANRIWLSFSLDFVKSLGR